RLQGFDSADTDDLGQYRIRNLPAGKYFIGAKPRGADSGAVDSSAKAAESIVAVPTFYPGVRDPGMAVPVEVAAGARLAGVDISITRTPGLRVSGRVVRPSAAESGGISVWLRDRSRTAVVMDSGNRTAVRNAGGDFEFRGVPSGSYLLQASGPGKLQGNAAV